MHIGAALTAIGLVMAGWANAPAGPDTATCAIDVEIRNHTAEPVTIDWAGSEARVTKTWPGGRPEGVVTGLGHDGHAETVVPAASRAIVARTLPLACTDLRQISARVQIDRGAHRGEHWFEQTQRSTPGSDDTAPVINVHRWHRPHPATNAGACPLQAGGSDAPD